MAKRYQLARAVKVRDEEFGLLFYLCKTTDLVFINSGSLLKAQALIDGGTPSELLAASGTAETALEKTVNLLDKLVGRGLLHAEG